MSGYNRTTGGFSPSSFGFDGATIDLSAVDFTVPDTVKAIVVVVAGDVVCRPVNAAVDITIEGAPVGFVLPWHCATIVKTDTTATLATVLG